MNCNNEINKGRWLTPFPLFTEFTPVIPSMYWDVYSAEQRYKTICEQLHKLVCYADYLGMHIDIDHEAIEKLESEFEEFKESGFFDYYAEQLENWINENMDRIFEYYCKQVFFGLTDDGYFCAYIPQAWSDITFDTGYNWGRFDYGRLILRFNADGSGVIDNTGRYDDANTTGILARIEELERRVNLNSGTLYNPMG